MQMQNESAFWDTIDVAEYDMVTIERRARELRAQAIADMTARFVGWTMRKLHVSRPAMRDQAV